MKKETQRSSRLFFQIVKKAMRKLGFDLIANNREFQAQMSPPKGANLADRMEQASFKKQIDFLTIKLRTTFNPKTGRYNRTGKIWILVTAPDPDTGEKIIFDRYFRRKPGVQDRVVLLVTALTYELQHRPSDTGGEFMELVEPRPKQYEWRSVHYKRNRESQPFLANLPPELQSKINALWRPWLYYEKTTRPKKEITVRESDIRRKWKVKNPKALLPHV